MNIFKLIECGSFIGHKNVFKNVSMKNFLIFKINKINILNLKKTVIILFILKNLFKNIIKEKNILFIGTKNFVREIIYKYARALNQPFICNKWIGGILTNSTNYKKLLNKSIDLKKKIKMNFTKKEKNIFLKEEKKIEILFGGLKNLKKNPDFIFTIDPVKDKIAIDEAFRLNIKIISLIDSNDNCSKIDYLIPCNNDSISTINLIFKILFSELC